MIVYEADKKQFLFDSDYEDIEEIILQRFKSVTGKSVGKAEIRSWKGSLGYMAKVLRDEDIPNDAGIAVEFHIPQMSKRIDIVVSGHDADKQKNIVVVELKQWDEIKTTNKDAIVITRVGGRLGEHTHPSYQAWSYATILEGFSEAVHDGGIAIRPCAYLHNYVRDGLIDAKQYAGYIDKAPLFLQGANERKLLSEFIKKHVKYGDSKALLYELENGKIRPSKALADSLKGMIKSKPEFVLIDDQKVIYEASLAAAKSSSSAHPKVVIIEGGPGTGKTVLAVQLLVALTGLGLVGKYVSKNAAPRRVYESKLVGTINRTAFSNLFVGSGGFIDTPLNEVDFLVVDEAHRLNEKSGLYGNLGENQIKELITSSKCTIFLIDEDQRVTLGDIGNKETIREFAVAKGAVIQEYVLESQFRCNGSDGYLAWLDNTLDIRETANDTLTTKEYDFQVFDSPEALHQAIELKNKDNKARVVAGYCWPWVSKKDSTKHDIVIGDNYRRQWNLDQDGSLWIIAKDSVDQVGCIHTCQGLEVDYVGVIVGPDFVVDKGQVTTVPSKRARQDRTLLGHKSRLKENPQKAQADADIIIKNTYRTLMTRGMKGCYIYCTDVETTNYFRNRLGLVDA